MLLEITLASFIKDKEIRTWIITVIGNNIIHYIAGTNQLIQFIQTVVVMGTIRIPKALIIALAAGRNM